jgi:hypothetical protein
MASLRLRVVFPNQRVVSVDVHGSDTARTVALSGPPLKQAVILLHHGRCLSPHLSLEVQGVASGDLIVLHTVSGPDRSRKSPSRQSTGDSSDGVFHEMLRLADIAFLPYEIASFADLVYQQSGVDEQAEDDERCEMEPMATVLGERPTEVSCEKLPSFWVDPAGE